MTCLDCQNKLLRLLRKGVPVKCYIVSNDTRLTLETKFFDPWYHLVSYKDWKNMVSLNFRAFLLGYVPVSLVDDVYFNCRQLFIFVKGGDDNGKRY